MRIFLVTASLLLMSVAVADSWRPAQSLAAVSENAEWLVRLEPGTSMGDVYGFVGTPKGEYAEATLFKYDDNLESYAEVKKYRTRNPIAPVDILLSNSGWLVAIDNWHNLGIGTVVASYNSEGALVRELNLVDIFSPEEIERLDHSVSSIRWRCGHPILDPIDTYFGVWDTLGRTLSIDYADGTVKVISESGLCSEDGP